MAPIQGCRSQALRYLPRDMNDSISRHLNTYFDGVRQRVRRERDAAVEAMAKAEAMVSKDQIKTDLDRRALKAQLTA